MLKVTAVLLFLVMTSIVPLHAQTAPDVPRVRVSQNDLRQVISKQTKNIKSQSLAVDAKEMEKLRRQVPKSRWTKTQTAITILVVVGIAALVFLLVKYGKDCLRYENNCNPSDENCYCEEYAEDNRTRRAAGQ